VLYRGVFELNKASVYKHIAEFLNQAASIILLGSCGANNCRFGTSIKGLKTLLFSFQARSQRAVSRLPVSTVSRPRHLAFTICHLFLIGVHLHHWWQSRLHLAGYVRGLVSADSTMLREAIGCFPCWGTIHGRRHRELVRSLQ
jgi:hypothetical protein